MNAAAASDYNCCETLRCVLHVLYTRILFSSVADKYPLPPRAAGHYSRSLEDEVVQPLDGVGGEGAPDEVSISVDCEELCQPRKKNLVPFSSCGLDRNAEGKKCRTKIAAPGKSTYGPSLHCSF